MPYKDPIKRRDAKHLWYVVNTKRILNKARRLYANNPEKKRESVRLWRSLNLEKVREKDRNRYAKNPTVKLKYARRWNISNKDKRNQNHKRRRARKKGVVVKPIRPNFWAQRLNDFKNRCAYCRRDLRASGAKLHWDHVVPLALGGAHAEENLVPSCSGCNLRKGKMTGDEFKKRTTDK